MQTSGTSTGVLIAGVVFSDQGSSKGRRVGSGANELRPDVQRRWVQCQEGNRECLAGHAVKPRCSDTLSFFLSLDMRSVKFRIVNFFADFD